MDMEKVIKGLEHCKKYGSLGGNDCNGYYEYTDNLQEIIKANNHRKDCPYGKCKTGCVVTLVADTIAMLKEQADALEQMRLDNTDLRNCNAELLKKQEAKQAIKHTYHVMMNRDYENPVEVTRYDWLCPACKSLLCRDIDVIDDNYHFCKVCGQAVKWE